MGERKQLRNMAGYSGTPLRKKLAYEADIATCVEDERLRVIPALVMSLARAAFPALGASFPEERQWLTFFSCMP